jgi:hypothetical protein
MARCFGGFWELLRDRGLLEGKTVEIDATTLEANAMRSIVRRDRGESFAEFQKGLAKKVVEEEEIV